MTFTYETLGSVQVVTLPDDRDDIIMTIVQDEERGEELCERLAGLAVGGSFLVNESDPEYVERWTRTS